MCSEETREQKLDRIFTELRKPFHPSNVTWKPGAVKGDRALALAYADLRAYMNRLDEVCGYDWSVAYEPWEGGRIICQLTIMDVTRSSTGESNKESDRGEIGGTVAEAQAFKRAAAMFGLGRYLYNLPTGWADFDPATKKFTEKAKSRLMGILVQHYRRSTEGGKDELADIFAQSAPDATDATTTPDDKAQGQKSPQGASVPASEGNDDLAKLHRHFHALGSELYGSQWENVRKRNVQRISNGKAESSNDLTPDQVQALVNGMKKLKERREVA